MGYLKISMSEFEQKAKQSDAVLIDVRTELEFKMGGALPHAINLNILLADSTTRLENLEKSKTYLVYCDNGLRSGVACAILIAKGFTQVYNLEGGTNYWEDAANW